MGHSATQEGTGRQESRGNGMTVMIYLVNAPTTKSCKLLSLYVGKLVVSVNMK
uniref:Uncharacterized protein n=1 Tax=Arundo donax TaxID=35708 RepID=A0A0A8XN39_ARUDO